MAILSASIAVEVSAFFTANVPPNPQHCSAAGQLDQVDARAPRRSSRSGLSPTRSIRRRVAGRVIGDAVREVRADVGDAEHVDQELGQLVGPARPTAVAPRGQPRVPDRRATIAC